MAHLSDPVEENTVLSHIGFTHGNIIASGEIFIKDGKIILLTNRSGHYQPTARHLVNFIQSLNNMHLFSENCSVEITTMEETTVTTLDEFLVNNKVQMKPK